MQLENRESSFGTTDDFEIILWIYYSAQSALPIFSFPRSTAAIKQDTRLSTKIYSFLSMVNENLTQSDWSIMSVPVGTSKQNYRALCLGHFIETSWVVLSLIVPTKFARWLLGYSSEMIPKFYKFFALLKERVEVDTELETMLHTILNDFKQYSRGIENLGITDFSSLDL